MEKTILIIILLFLIIGSAVIFFSMPDTAELLITNTELRVLSGHELVKYIPDKEYILNDNNLPTITITLNAKGDNIKNLKTQYSCDFLVNSEKFGAQSYSACDKQNACENSGFSRSTQNNKNVIVVNDTELAFLEKDAIIKFGFQINTYSLVKHFKNSSIDASDSDYFNFKNCVVKFYSLEQEIVEEVIITDYLVKNNFKNLN